MRALAEASILSKWPQACQPLWVPTLQRASRRGKPPRASDTAELEKRLPGCLEKAPLWPLILKRLEFLAEQEGLGAVPGQLSPALGRPPSRPHVGASLLPRHRTRGLAQPWAGGGEGVPVVCAWTHPAPSRAPDPDARSLGETVTLREGG